MLPSPKTEVSPCSPSIHVHVSRQAGAQGTVAAARFGNGDSNGDALDDLGEVAGGVVGRQQCELRSRRSTYAGDFPLGDAPTVGVNLELDRLANADLGELGLLEVGCHPDSGVGDDAEQGLTRCDQLSDLDL